jgi:hypothetical protein
MTEDHRVPFYGQQVGGFLACRRPRLAAAVKGQHRLGAILVPGDRRGDGGAGGVVAVAGVLAVAEAGNRVFVSPGSGDLGFAGRAGWPAW